MLKEEKEKMGLWKKIVLVLSILAIIIFGVMYHSRYIATTGLIVKEYKVTDRSLPDSFHGVKIIHISDIHYKTTYFKKEIDKMVKKINQIKPDIVVLTGDLFDKNTHYTNEDFIDLTTLLSSIDTSIGKYAISGNHDVKITEWETVIKNSGFINLDNYYELVYKDSLKPILLAGVSSNLNNLQDINSRMKDIDSYLTSIQNNEKNNNIPAYKILFIHEPDYIDDIDYSRYNLILAGHSHNGQIRIPGIGAMILPVGAQKYYKEHYSLNGTELYISSGLGTSTYPYRFFNKPAINLYRLTNK